MLEKKTVNPTFFANVVMSVIRSESLIIGNALYGYHQSLQRQKAESSLPYVTHADDDYN